jgi:death-on-curing protein
MTQEPEFLTLDDVLDIHARQLERFDGQAGLRDQGLLESALAQPQASFGGTPLHEDLFEMASAYAFHVARNHPFFDGNKRTALITALTFLTVNGFTVPESDRLYEAMLAVATGQLDKKELAALLRKLASPLP